MEIDKKTVAQRTYQNPAASSILRQDDKTSKAKFFSWMEEKGYLIRNEKGALKYGTDWHNKEDRVAAVRKMVEIMGIHPTELKNEDFFNIGLFDVLKIYTIKKGSFPAVFNALKEAYPELEVNLWDIPSLKNIISRNRETAEEATRWLMAKKNGAVSESDFSEYGVSFVLSLYNNPFDAMIFSQPSIANAQCVKALAEKYLDNGFIQNQNKRRAAIKFLANVKGSPKLVTYSDFEEFGFVEMPNYYSSNPLAMKTFIKQEDKKKLLVGLALSDAFKDFNIWEMGDPPKSLFIDKSIRIETTIWLSKSSGKHILKLSRSDWERNGLSWILEDFYNGYEYNAIREAMDSL